MLACFFSITCRAATGRERTPAVRSFYPFAAVLAICAFSVGTANADPLPTINPKVATLVAAISEERITGTLKHLETFGTRNSLSSETDPSHGVGAARQWIHDQFHSYSPRLQCSLVPFRVKTHGRIVRDTTFVDVVAVLPGTVHPDHQILISAHYDSLAIVRKPAAAASDDNTADTSEEASAAVSADWLKSADAPISPGVTDDGSGVAAVLEMARVMSQYEFESTLVFVAFAGEEQGLIGSTLYANQAQKDGRHIDAVLNNDIIGSDVAGDGRRANRTINIYSGDPNDSPSRTLARYIKEVSENYVPMMNVNLIFREDRFARAGDHTPFIQAGYAAVRFTTPTEQFANQHSPTDTFENTSPNYTTQVARVNAAAAATLALAPTAPSVTRVVAKGERKGTIVPRISRGKSGYDAVLRWTPSAECADLAGYFVLSRSTLSPFWEKKLYVGNVQEYTLPHVSIDDIVFGVQAVDKEGNLSLVSPYVMIPRKVEEIQTY